MRKAAVQLSSRGAAWLAARLQAAFLAHGTIAQDSLNQLDWPTLP